jgi:GT2 family glycosyltransferase
VEGTGEAAGTGDAVKLAVVVIGDGRGHYLQQAVQSITSNVLHPITARIMVDDSGDADYGAELDVLYPEYLIVHGGRRGMAGAVQAGFDAALSTDPDYVLWVEEDFILVRQLPIGQAIQVMESHHDLAQMMFKRQPLAPDEIAGDDVIAGLTGIRVHNVYTEHTHIFSMNPCLIPRRVVAMGWPAGPLGVGNEAGMTAKLLDAGYRFGVWGHLGDPRYCEHIGAERSAGYAL